MPVRIGSMTTEWANSQIVYTAIGMHITDTASASDSKLINLSVNSNSKFSVDKTGLFRITPDLPANSTISLFSVVNSGEELIEITPNTWHNYSNVVLVGSTNYIKTYTEGLQYIQLNGAGTVTFDLGIASTFIVDAWAGNTSITGINFVKPGCVIDDYTRSYSCSVLFRGNIIISDAVWSSANVRWPGGVGPGGANRQVKNETILTFLNSTTDGGAGAYAYPSNTWIGISGGLGFKPV